MMKNKMLSLQMEKNYEMLVILFLLGTGGNLAPWAVPRYTSVTLNMLRFIYGDLTPQRIIELKAACRKEVYDLCTSTKM